MINTTNQFIPNNTCHRIKIDNLLNNTAFTKNSFPNEHEVIVSKGKINGPRIITYCKGTKQLGISTGEKHENVTPIGEGTHGKVFSLKNDKAFVVKKLIVGYCLESNLKDVSFEKEWKIARQLNHPNLLKVGNLYNKVKNKKNTTLIKQKLVMEKIHGLSLLYISPKFSKNDLISLIKQLESVALYIHDKGICWGDLHNDNIMVERRSNTLTLKLIDYGEWFTINDKEHSRVILFNELYTAVDQLFSNSIPDENNNTNPAISSISEIFKIPLDELLSSDYLKLEGEGILDLSFKADEKIEEQFQELETDSDFRNFISSFIKKICFHLGDDTNAKS